jgi:all-trans-retinol 13,14-reductase
MIAIIGSGISALTAGALLARRGKEVVVLEQYMKPGGYMHSFKRFDELYDTGAHYMGALGERQPFRVLLEYLGVFDEKLFAPLNPEGFDVLKFPEGELKFPRGYENVISELSSVFPRSPVEKYFRLIERIPKHFPTYTYSSASDGVFPPEALDLSLKQVVEEITDDPRLQSVFYSYCTLHGVRPEDIAFGFHAIVTDSLIRGPYGLNGGGDALTRKFVDVIESAGGKVLTRHKVSGLTIENRQIKRIQCDNGAEFTPEWVISTMHPKATFRLIEDPSIFPPVFRERMKNMKESTGIFGMYATCAEKPVARPDANYYFFRSSDPKEMFAATNPGETPPVVFLSSPKRDWSADEKNFPISLHAAFPYEWVAQYAGEPYGRRSQGYKDLKLQVADGICRAVEKYDPGFSAKIRQFHTSTPLTHLHFNGSEEGSSYGIYHSIQNTGARALGPRTKVLNLLIAGQSCLFPGLLGAATSALRTCGHITGIKPILAELECASS